MCAVIPIFLSPDVPGFAGGAPVPTPAPEAPPPVPTPPAAPVLVPPAAKIVTEADVLSIRADLEAERAGHAETAAAKKAREVRIAELEDELHRLKAAMKPEPKAKKAPGLREWLTGEGWEG